MHVEIDRQIEKRGRDRQIYGSVHQRFDKCIYTFILHWVFVWRSWVCVHVFVLENSVYWFDIDVREYIYVCILVCVCMYTCIMWRYIYLQIHTRIYVYVYTYVWKYTFL